MQAVGFAARKLLEGRYQGRLDELLGLANVLDQLARANVDVVAVIAEVEAAAVQIAERHLMPLLVLPVDTDAD